MNSARPTAPPYTYRSGTAGDARALVALAEVGFARWGGYGETILTWSQLPGVHTRIAETAPGHQIGFVMFGRVQYLPESPPVVDIVAMATAAAHRRQGVGRALLDAAFDEIGRWQIAEPMTWLTVAADNEAGRRFFEDAGFVRQPVLTPAYPNGTKSHRMARPITRGDTLGGPPPAVQIWADPRLG